jgi:hypothetical protein
MFPARDVIRWFVGRSLVLAWLMLMPAVLLAQDRPPGGYVQVSAMMRDMRDVISPGVIQGSLYNEHPTRAIRIAEVVVESSGGKRIFKFACVLGPYETKEFYLATGLRLDFRDTPKGWWTLVATRASWAAGPDGQKRCPDSEGVTR